MNLIKIKHIHFGIPVTISFYCQHEHSVKLSSPIEENDLQN